MLLSSSQDVDMEINVFLRPAPECFESGEENFERIVRTADDAPGFLTEYRRVRASLDFGSLFFGFLPQAQGQGFGEALGKVRVVLSKGRVVAGIAVKFVPCFKLLGEIQDNMKKVTYNSKGLRMCLEKAIPRDEEIEGKENVYVTRDEMRTKIKTCISSMVAAARGKSVDDDDVLVDVKECFMDAGQSLSALNGDDKEGGKEGH